jgi:non-specific protein-tyrosine kinase
MQVNRTVLLVEADLRSPVLADKFGSKPPFGLVDYLLSDTPLSECIVDVGIDGLFLLPARAAQVKSSELLASPKMQTLVKELKSRVPGGIVVYDLPPLLVGDDALTLINQVDACLLVISEGSTPRRDIERSIELVGKEALIGTVLNKSQDRPQASYY